MNRLIIDKVWNMIHQTSTWRCVAIASFQEVDFTLMAQPSDLNILENKLSHIATIHLTPSEIVARFDRKYSERETKLHCPERRVVLG